MRGRESLLRAARELAGPDLDRLRELLDEGVRFGDLLLQGLRQRTTTA